MTVNITCLPYELLSYILHEATLLTGQEQSQYTYGLSQAPEPLQNVQIQSVVRGQICPDAQKWNATDAIRQVNRLWHDWATNYSLRNLYIKRWRGSERWIQSRFLDNLQVKPLSIAVYRDPYHSLRNTAELFNGNPALATCVRRIWFDGYYGAETNALMFDILRRCPNLDNVTVPWTALRYGSAEDWSRLLGRNKEGHSISSLEFLAVDLKQSQMSNEGNQMDKKVLDSPMVKFDKLRRLKIFGHSDFSPLTDDHLKSISCTATNLREIHVTGTISVTINGILHLTSASRSTLETLEHSPLSANGFSRLDPVSVHDSTNHLCQLVLACPNLRNLSVSLPTICADLFADLSVIWEGEVQIRTAAICNRYTPTLKDTPQSRNQLWHNLDQARALMSARHEQGKELDVEIFIDNWIFEPRSGLVHGNFELGKVLSDGSWPVEEQKSGKGPYGQTGLYGKADAPYTCIAEEVFAYGLSRGYIS